MIHGTIKLLSWEGVLISKKHYRDKEARDKIIANWEDRLYKGFPKAMIHIYPIADIHKVKKNGQNMGIKAEPPLVIPEAPLIRPAAQYDNHRPYDYS